jgi:hypothetical protein
VIRKLLPATGAVNYEITLLGHLRACMRGIHLYQSEPIIHPFFSFLTKRKYIQQLTSLHALRYQEQILLMTAPANLVPLFNYIF